MTTPSQPEGQPQGQPEGATVVVEDTSISPAEQKALLDRIGRAWWVVLLLGIISLIVGVVVSRSPFHCGQRRCHHLWNLALVSGVIQLAQAFDKQLETISRVLNAITGVIGIVLGLICLDSAEDRIVLLTLFIGIWWIMRGIVQIAVGAVTGRRCCDLPRNSRDHRRWCCVDLANRIADGSSLVVGIWLVVLGNLRNHCVIPGPLI